MYSALMIIVGPYIKKVHVMNRAHLFTLNKSNKHWLTAHNWRKWKSTFLTCPCHEVYRVEAVGLKGYNHTEKKNTIFVKMWNLGQFWGNLNVFPITA